MPGKRRSMKRRVPVSRPYIVGLCDKIDELEYGVCVVGGLSISEQRIRNKALVSFLYVSARRISEIVGRDYEGDHWRGIQLEDIRYDVLGGRRVMVVNCRILKKGTVKRGFREDYADVVIDMEDEPFISHIETWIEHQKEWGEAKLFPLSRSRAYQILKQIDPAIVGPHWFRHQRLSHLAEALNPFQLHEQIGFWETIEPAVSYVHGRVEDYLQATKLVREGARTHRKT